MAKILVIDDDVDILSVMEILLTMQGYTVEATSRGETVFERVASFEPDLILLDVLISGHDGRVICKKLKADEETKDIPVIMFSAHPGAAASIQEYGADDFVSKPFDVEHLLEKVKAELSKARKKVL